LDEAADPGGPTRGRRLLASPWLAPLAVVAIACLLPINELWRAPGPQMEEGFMLVFPELVLEGQVPNRDFLHLYGPGSLWALAGAFKVFGTSLATERAVGFLQQLAVVFGVVALLRPWGRWVAASGGVIVAVVLVPPIGLTAMAWTGAVAFGLWALDHALTSLGDPPESSRRRRGLTIAGLLAGAALLYRPDLVLAIGLAAIVVWRGLDRAGRRRLAGAFALGVSPYLVHMALAGPGNTVRGLVIEPVFDLRGGRSLPFPPPWDHFDSFLQRVWQLVEPAWPLPAPSAPVQLNLWLGLLFAANAALVVAGVARFRRGDRGLLALALFCVGLLPQAIQRVDSTHLAWAGCVTLGLLPAAVVEGVRAWRPQWRPGRVAIGAAAVPLVATFVLAPTLIWAKYADYVRRSFGMTEIEAGTIRHGGREFHYGRTAVVDAADAMLDDVDRISEPGDSLFVGTGDLRKTPYSEAFLYYLLPELEPSTRYIELDPGLANAEDSGLADDLRETDVVILATVNDDWDEPNNSRKLGSNEPNEVLAEEFCLVGRYGEGQRGRGLYELYEKCSARV
jgi:hypothetical protein